MSRSPGAITRGSPLARLRAVQVNVLLEVLVLCSLATGLTSWAVGTGWGRWWTVAHGVSGLSLLALMPAKLRRSVRTGMRRRRATRWLSVAFGVLVLAAIATGLTHATGARFGVGLWSTLWVHVLAAFALVPLFVWHVKSRPARVHRHDADRRLLVGGAAAVGIAAATYTMQELASQALGTAGGSRRFTGSHERGSFDPDRMPTVSWIDDHAPAEVDEWELTIGGERVRIERLRAIAVPFEATIDCTGGWWSRQTWDVVPLAALVEGWESRSVEVTSSTGYSRLLPMADAGNLYLAVGYGGRPLRRGHGEPVRLVAPGRRGPWWVKWVVSVEPNDRPWWFQLPFPIT